MASSFLSAEWINSRLDSVLDRVDRLLDRLIDQGLLSSGYPPGETPLTDAMLRRMTPDEIRTLIQSLPTAEEKATLMARIVKLGLGPVLGLPEPKEPPPLRSVSDLTGRLITAEQVRSELAGS